MFPLHKPVPMSTPPPSSQQSAIRVFVDALRRFRAGPRPGGGGATPPAAVFDAAGELLNHLDPHTHHPLVAALTKLRNGLAPGVSSQFGVEAIRNTDQLLADLEAMSASESPPALPTPPPAVSPIVASDTPYTLIDLREYVVFREQRAQFEVRRRQVLKPVYRDASEFHSHIQWEALNSPYPGRITDAIAPTLPAFRRLQEASLPRYGELTPLAFDCLVAETLERAGYDTVTAGTLTLEEFAVAFDTANEPAPPPNDDELAGYRWLKVRQVAGLFDFQAGTVSKWADNGKFVTNGETGNDRRIDVLSVIRQQLAQLDSQASAGPDGE